MIEFLDDNKNSEREDWGEKINLKRPDPQW